MAKSIKLKEMIDDALVQTGEESSMLLGQQLKVDENDSLNTNKISYFSGMEDAIFVASVETREEYPGQFYMIFSLRDAILLSGLLLGIPLPRISEKRKLAIMEADDVDAFGEIMNQVIGSFNSVFKSSLPEKIHLKLNAPKKFIPGIDEMSDDEPIVNDEYVLFRSQMNMDGVEMDRLDILMPVSLAHLIEPPAAEPEQAEVAETGDGLSDVVAGEKPATINVGNKTILVLEDDELARESLKQYLSAAGWSVVDAPLKADIRELFANNDAEVAVIGVAETEDRELALCIKINAMRQGSPLPIIMCASQWTRTGVLKALKYGAKEIILKPYDADELVSKVTKFLKAA
ncbi:MAG: response regulator [Geobacter sp.]|nr:response regulator [Geobacter sp.]